MRILEIGTGYTSIPAQIGAATEIVVEELARSFDALGMNVEVLDVADEERQACELKITEVKMPFFAKSTDEKLGVIHKLRRVGYSVALAFTLKKILKNAKEKICIHFHNQYNMFFYQLLVPSGLRRKAYTAYTIHSHIWHGKWNEIKNDIKRKYFQECMCVREADVVFALNEITKQNLIEYIKAEPARIRLIDNGVNTDVYRPLALDERQQLKNQTKFENKKVFIHVGSVCERKNQLKAIELLQPFMQEDKNVVFCYAGGIVSEEYQRRIIEFSKENGIEKQVFYFGEIKPGEKLNEFYNLADAMVFPSKAEGFSLVILEAMSAGVPVFVPMGLEFRLSDECIQYDTDEQFCSCMKNQIFNDENRKNHSAKARKAVVDHYSWNKIASEYLFSFMKQ